MFQLKCQQFVELVRQMVQEPATADKRLAETMQFGQQLQDTYSGRLTDAQQAQLEVSAGALARRRTVRAGGARLSWAVGRSAACGAQETFSLLAYPDPFRSPVAHLLEPAKREDVAAAANSAVLGMRRGPFAIGELIPSGAPNGPNSG